MRVCANPACRSALASKKPGATLISVPPPACERCHASDARRGAAALADRCAEVGISRLAIVGGSPSLRVDLERLLAGTALELRLIDGTVARSKREGAIRPRVGRPRRRPRLERAQPQRQHPLRRHSRSRQGHRLPTARHRRTHHVRLQPTRREARRVTVDAVCPLPDARKAPE